MTHDRFPSLSLDTALPAARKLLTATQDQFGFLPSPVAKAAASPALLERLLSTLGTFERTSLSTAEREVLAMTIAFQNECHYCMALHSALLARDPETAALVPSLRAGIPLESPRLEAVRCFTLAVLEGHGRVPSREWQRWSQAGFTTDQALEVLVGVAAYTLSTFANRLTEAELDAPFQAFEWQPPRAAVTAQT